MTLRMRHIMLFIVLTHTAFGAARLTGTLYALSNKASAFTVGVQMALFALVPALLAVRAGRWLDTAGPFRPLLLGISLMTAGALLPALFWPLSVAALIYTGGALLYYRRTGSESGESPDAPLKNPFELGPALRFAALLALILLLIEAAQRGLGDAGVYLVALVSGLADVDAITLSLARSSHTELDNQVAVRGILLAALSNSLVKAFLVALIGGRQLALLTLPVMAAGLLAGALVLLLT